MRVGCVRTHCKFVEDNYAMLVSPTTQFASAPAMRNCGVLMARLV